MSKKIKVLSLFDGISCGMVALERSNFQVERYVAFENDENPVAISKSNYPFIEHKGDVFSSDFTEYEGFDLVIGGSPCTYWSCARLNTGKEGTVERETKPEGLGYELFCQYVKAVKTVKPKYFLYENNYSISQEIKDQITKDLGVEPIMINSELVSAQQRKRMYWTNIPNIKQPEDKGITLNMVLSKDREWFYPQPWSYKVWGTKRKIDTLRTIDSEKSFTVTTSRTHPKNFYLSSDRTKMTKLTCEEAEQLQTLPVGYTSIAKQGARFKSIGNGWTVDVIAHIFKNMEF